MYIQASIVKLDHKYNPSKITGYPDGNGGSTVL